MIHSFLSRIDASEQVQQLEKETIAMNSDKDLDALINKIGDATYVLLGEGSYGTHEYHLWRSKISQRLIKEKGFSFVAVESDWPDCYKLNRYVKSYSTSGENASEVLRQFSRWPSWKCANWEVVAWIEWLKSYNNSLPTEKKVGFYGLDLYSLWESLYAIIKYLEKVDHRTLKAVRRAWNCFVPYQDREGKFYAQATFDFPISCEKEVLEMLKEIHLKVPIYDHDREAVFNAEQNALVAVHAEQYYRTMLFGGTESWNIRDNHMAETLERLLHFHGNGSKAIVWGHNTHICDARATDMASEDLINMGELVRKKHHSKGVILVGMGAYKGSIAASKTWGGSLKIMDLPEAAEGSWEYLLHHCNKGNQLLIMDNLRNKKEWLKPINQRSIEVIYNPDVEKENAYMPSVMPIKYDAYLFFDESSALHPLHLKPKDEKVPSAFPWSI